MTSIATLETKNALLDKLSVALNRAYLAKASCQNKGLSNEAQAFQTSITSLETEIDRLLKEILQEWSGQADSLTRDLDTANGRLEIAIRNIQKSINTAQNIIKAIGYLDTVINTASKMVV